MRTYLILREKVRRFHADTEITRALATADADMNEPRPPEQPGCDAFWLRSSLLLPVSAPERCPTQGFGHERLDQLVTELLLGSR